MGAVHIVQHLCPQRHCIMGGAFVVGEKTYEEVVETIKRFEAEMRIHPWCGICGSHKLEFEERATRFNTMDEARPELARLQQANLAALELIAPAPKPN